MKEIKAIIQPFMLSKVVNALKGIPQLPGITVDTSVRGFGRTRATNSKVKVVDESIEYVPKVKLEIVVPDSLLEMVIQTIQQNAHTGRAGDGKIFVYSVVDVVRIRTNEHGEGAL